jgi:hypothetical protein
VFAVYQTCLLSFEACCNAENQVLQIVLKDHDRLLGDTEIGRSACSNPNVT